MHIKSVTIDGFKSYAQRTEVGPFDPMFNAITGLNGSGKSNILDSICFLLGITNLSQVRATSLHDLVYKNGQAGVTRAVVSIVFDNKDKKQTPIGYDHYDEITVTRQVVVGGRNKYLINGMNANNTRVADMFRSVQLNVNNPHFLIMQGRITKVLNMKGPEILGMLEEAAGTKLYESKKDQAQRTIERKDAKLNEIQAILDEEITPTLARLKEERSSYLEYQRIVREIEHLNKLVLAYRFIRAQEVKNSAGEKLAQMNEKMKKLTDRQAEIKNKVKVMESETKELEKKRDKEAGGMMGKLEEDLKAKEKEEAKAASNVNYQKQTIKGEQKKIKDLKKEQTADEKALAKRTDDLKRLEGECAALLTKSQKDQEALVKAQAHYQAVSAGLMTSEDGEDQSLNGQLMAAKSAISNIDTEKKTADMRLKHSKQEVKKKEAELKSTEQSYARDEKVYKSASAEINKLKADLDKIDYEDGKEERLEDERRKKASETQKLRAKVEAMDARLSQLQFNYRDPEKNFDRSKVHGLIVYLFKVNDVMYATALEQVAGGKLYNVVVETEQTGKKILKDGGLKRRCTFIPLNKISGGSIDNHRVKLAQNLVGKDNVHPSLSLIDYKPEHAPAMKFVFGGAFVCSDINVAKKVTFDSGINTRSVTLDGDSFNPQGTLSGGARPQTRSVLMQISELMEAQAALEQSSSQLKKIEDELRGIKGTAAKWADLHQRLELKQNEADAMKEKLQQSSHGQQLQEIDRIRKEIVEDETTLATAEKRLNEAKAKIKDLEYKIKNAKSLREAELKNAEKQCTVTTKALEESDQQTRAKEQEVEAAKLEIESLEKEIDSYNDQVKVAEANLAKFQDELQQLNAELEGYQATTTEAREKLQEQKDRLKSCMKELEATLHEHTKLVHEGNAADLEIQELKHSITKCQDDERDAEAAVRSMRANYEWMADEEKYFGQPGTDYDFETYNPKDAQKKLQKLEETKDKLGKSVNMRAMNLLGKAEEQYTDLMSKRHIVLSDKAKIAAVITELDEKKNEALRKAHTQVNQNFGSIFSMLLPGTQAKLNALMNGPILQGLEIRVAFGGVWKESLQELSGGQRSLVALSLILSLLLFKPAPLYILDEVDAALDSSHTQNIGHVLKTHFRHSQFIVVSLKDGMFNNANVLFKTSFIDGVSTVTRYAHTDPGRPININAASDKGNKKARKA